MKRTARAVWKGTGLEGSGTLATQSGVFDGQPYSAKLRFQNEDGTLGTNPEELIAAAHAGCFAMALSFQLSGAGTPPESLDVQAVLTMEKEDAGWTIQKIRLELQGRVPGVSEDQFQELAAKAKAGCPVSRVLNAEIELDARLVS
ncbi:MAG: OsmC family protein [Gemmatimonadota bacterium]|nr:OsmC family protein [Gemmatimonadota bacterium]